MSRPDSADVLVARAPDLLALIWMKNDSAAALDLCRLLHDLRTDVVISLRRDTDDRVEPRGRPMPAKFPGRCATCAAAIGVGDPIYYDAESRKAVHARCA